MQHKSNANQIAGIARKQPKISLCLGFELLNTVSGDRPSVLSEDGGGSLLPQGSSFMDRDEIGAVRELARSFALRELAPVVADHDEREEFPSGVYAKLVQTGLHALNLPERFGGGGSLYAMALAGQELGAIDPGFALSVLASSQLFAYNVVLHGSQEQQELYLPAIVGGSIGCWALTEPDVGSDALGIRTRAQKVQGGYVLDGSKTFITNAPIADLFIVICRERGEGIEGGTAFILERDQAGLELSPAMKKHGHRTSPTGQIFLSKCEVSDSQVLGEPGRAFYDMKRSLDLERLVFGAIGIGIMRECRDRAVAYCASRRQFGKPIADFQLVQAYLAEIALRLDMSEAYFEKTFSALGPSSAPTYEAALFKYAVSEWCLEVVDTSLQLHGGSGYTREVGIEKLLRDARLYTIGGGTSEMNKLVLGKQLLRRSLERR